MGKRSTSRRIAMQALYEVDHGQATIEEALQNILEQESIVKDTSDFAYELAVGSFSKKDTIDSIIKKHSKGWSLERIGGVDRNILRLAIFELLDNKTPPQIVINEALELAKKYSSEEAAKFINGVLGGYIKEIKDKK